MFGRKVLLLFTPLSSVFLPLRTSVPDFIPCSLSGPLVMLSLVPLAVFRQTEFTGELFRDSPIWDFPGLCPLMNHCQHCHCLVADLLIEMSLCFYFKKLYDLLNLSGHFI